MIRPLLAHTTNKTGEKYYNRATIIDASRRHGDAINELRKELALTDFDNPEPGV